ncbi:hypothetical protein [Streptomyces sp. NPDC055013]
MTDNGVTNLNPVVIGANKSESREMRTLFILNDKEYKVPAKLDPRLPIRLAKRLRECKTEEERMMAQLAMTEDLLGKENFEILMNDDEVSPEDFDAVLALVSRIAMGDSAATKN